MRNSTRNQQITKSNGVHDWNEVAKEVCAPGIDEKFCQNTHLMLLLKSTNNQNFVEASHDSVWGTGIPLKGDKCLTKDQWKNTGILGEILMEITTKYQESDSNILDQTL